MTTPAQLIRECFEQANVLDPGEEMQDGYPAIGLTKLNDILMQWSSLQAYIEAYIVQTVNVLANDYDYSITPPIIQILEAKLIDSQSCQSILNIADLKRQNTFNYALSAQGPGRPAWIFAQTSEAEIQTGSTLFFYPVPDQNYTATIYLKKRLNEVTQSETITQLSGSYMKPLKYQLTKDISDYYETVLSDRFMNEYEKLMVELEASNQGDMSVQNSNPFNYYGRRFRPWGGRYVG